MSYLISRLSQSVQPDRGRRDNPSRRCFSYKPGNCDEAPREDDCACITDDGIIQIGYGPRGKGEGKPPDAPIGDFCSSYSTYNGLVSFTQRPCPTTAPTITTSIPLSSPSSDVTSTTARVDGTGDAVMSTPVRNPNVYTSLQLTTQESSVAVTDGNEVYSSPTHDPTDEGAPKINVITWLLPALAAGLVIIIALVALLMYIRRRRNLRRSHQLDCLSHSRSDKVNSRVLFSASPANISQGGMNDEGDDVMPSGAQRIPLLTSSANGTNLDDGHERPREVAMRRRSDAAESTDSIESRNRASQPSLRDYEEVPDRNSSGLSSNYIYDYAAIDNLPVSTGVNLGSHNKSPPNQSNHEPPMVHPAPPATDPGRPDSKYDDVVVGNNSDQLVVDVEQDRAYVNQKVFAKRRLGKDKQAPKRSVAGTNYPPSDRSQQPVRSFITARDPPVPTDDAYAYVEIPFNTIPSPCDSPPACAEGAVPTQSPLCDGGYQALNPAGLEGENKYTPLILEKE
ncbi:uncharacterized protein LOC119729840 [Patiria miniata]|uniref:Uncharacterized protein n=1 Tax=Patiria miniata TaxID=46514 RepID=A0A914A580_PATMI|nr:uncharacterized protein LOC119729840 [Patiria miniata]